MIARALRRVHALSVFHAIDLTLFRVNCSYSITHLTQSPIIFHAQCFPFARLVKCFIPGHFTIFRLANLSGVRLDDSFANAGSIMIFYGAFAGFDRIMILGQFNHFLNNRSEYQLLRLLRSFSVAKIRLIDWPLGLSEGAVN